MEKDSFHNKEPRSREQRNMLHNKEAIEQAQKQARGAPPNPFQPAPNSPLYASAAERFSREIAASIKQETECKMQKKLELYERKRELLCQREKARWDSMTAQEQALEAKLVAKRETGVGALSNKSSEHYNIISLQYHDTQQGRELQQKDEAKRHRAAMRKELLCQKSHSVHHNIITGEALPPRSYSIMAQAAGGTAQKQ